MNHYEPTGCLDCVVRMQQDQSICPGCQLIADNLDEHHCTRCGKEIACLNGECEAKGPCLVHSWWTGMVPHYLCPVCHEWQEEYMYTPLEEYDAHVEDWYDDVFGYTGDYNPMLED